MTPEIHPDDLAAPGGQHVQVQARLGAIKAQLWADAYMARLRLGYAKTAPVDYLEHHAAVEMADKTRFAFEEKFPESDDDAIVVDGHCRFCGQMDAGTL